MNRAPVVYNVVNSLQTPEGNTAGQLAISPLVATDADGNNTIDYFTIDPASLPATSQGVLYYFDGVNYVAFPAAAIVKLTPTQATSLKFDPAAGFLGNVFFTYTATDNVTGGALTSNRAIYTIPVGQDNNSVYATTPAKGGTTPGYQNNDVLAYVVDINAARYVTALQIYQQPSI